MNSSDIYSESTEESRIEESREETEYDEDEGADDAEGDDGDSDSDSEGGSEQSSGASATSDGDEDEDADEAAPTEGKKAHPSTPRMAVGAGIDIDLVREQLENHGKVILVTDAAVFVSDRSVNLLSRALRVPRVPRTNGPTHYSIPRHVSRNGQLLASTDNWDPINWRTRGATPAGSRAILLGRAALRILPTEGLLSWIQIEELLRAEGSNGVYEPLAVAHIMEGDLILPRNELFGGQADAASSPRKTSRLLEVAASVFRGRSSAGTEPLVISDEAKQKWNEKLQSFALTKDYILVSPFGNSEEGIQDWAVERCAEVLRHALEWRQVQTIIVCQASDKGKAERLRIISGQNVAVIVEDLTSEELAAAIQQSRAVLSVPGALITMAHQLNRGTVCVTSANPNITNVSSTQSHQIVRAGDIAGDVVKAQSQQNAKPLCALCASGQHSCLEDLEAGPVARAMSKVLTN